MVLEDGEVVLLAKSLGDLLALARVKNDTVVLAVQSLALVERASVLRDRVENAALRRERLAKHRVRVHDGVDALQRRVDTGVDGEAGNVDRAVAKDDFSRPVDKNEGADSDVGKVGRKGVLPKTI